MEEGIIGGREETGRTIGRAADEGRLLGKERRWVDGRMKGRKKEEGSAGDVKEESEKHGEGSKGRGNEEE
jgi:hypothetical protein